MKRKVMTLVVAMAIPASAFAVDNVGSCGWGSKLFNGQKGVIPQVLAVTTNGSTGNQTFAITSGTSGCTQEGTVTSAWKTAAYVDANMNKLALDMSRGEGESLSSLASLLGVNASDSSKFNTTLQQNFAQIFSSPSVSSTEVASALKGVLASDATLAKYSANV